MVSAFDVVFYVLDLAIAIMLVRMILVSKTVKIKANTLAYWILPFLFFAVAILGALRYTGLFLWIQTIVLVAMGVMSFFIINGLSEKGVVVQGKVTPYEQLHHMSIDEKTGNFQFETKNGIGSMKFPIDQIENAKKYLKIK